MATVQVAARQPAVAGLAPRSSPTSAPAGSLPGTLRGVDIRPDGRAVVMGCSANGQEDLWTSSSTARRCGADERRVLRQGSALDRLGRSRHVPVQPRRPDRSLANRRPIEITDVPDDRRRREHHQQHLGRRTLISFQHLTKDARLWTFARRQPTQLTQDSLSDYSPGSRPTDAAGVPAQPAGAVPGLHDSGREGVRVGLRRAPGHRRTGDRRWLCP